MYQRVLMSRLLAEPEAFYGKAVVFAGYMALYYGTLIGDGGMVRQEFGLSRVNSECIWFDLPEKYRRESRGFEERYVLLYGVLQPSPAAQRRPGRRFDRFGGWAAVLDPLTYMLPLSNDSSENTVQEQHRRDCMRLLREGPVCPFCQNREGFRFLEKQRRRFDGGYYGGYLLCESCGRSFGPMDVADQ